MSEVKPVSFKKDEGDILEYLKKHGYYKAFSYYVKDLIRKDMQENELKESVKSNKANRKRNVNFDI